MKFLLGIVLIVSSHVAVAVLTPSDNQVLLSLGASSKSALPSKGIQVLVWNLHKGGDRDFQKDFALLSYKKDLIISQEMLLNPEMKKTFSDLPDYLFSTATSFFMGRDLNRTGVATGSQVPVITSRFLRTKNLEPITDSPKMTLINQYPIENQTEILTVINLHAINFVSAGAFSEEVERIAQLVISLNLLHHPLLFAGDFNTWSEERINILNNLTTKLNLTEASFTPDNRLTFMGNPLDHVFYSEHLELISAKSDLSYQGSDHRPLELIFNLKRL